MMSKQWYYAQLRWAVMAEGKEGLREWKEAVYIFLSEDQQTAFQQALKIGRLGEDTHTEGWREVDTRLAEIVRLDCLGSDRTQFQISIVQPKPTNTYRSITSSNRRSICPNRPSKNA